jgi:hypothetical protein
MARHDIADALGRVHRPGWSIGSTAYRMFLFTSLPSTAITHFGSQLVQLLPQLLYGGAVIEQ